MQSLASLHRGLRAPVRRAVRYLFPLIPLSLIPLLTAWPFLAARAGVGPNVKEVIEFTRIIQPVLYDDETLQSQISPDHQQAFIVTRKADVASDTNRFEILLLDLSQKSLAGKGPSSPVPVFTMETRHDQYDADPSLQEVRWVGNRTLAFRAQMNDEPSQVYTIDVLTRQVKQLTFSPLGTVAFDVSGDLKRVVYAAPVANPAFPIGAHSGVVGTHSFWSVYFSQLGPNYQQRRYQYFVTEAGSRDAARALGESFPLGYIRLPNISVSPDGRWAAVPKLEIGRELGWAKLYPQVAEFLAKWGASQTMDPLSYYSQPLSYVSRRQVIYRLADGVEQTIVDAPDDAFQGTGNRMDRIWQNGGKSLVLAGTYLPRHAGDPDSASAVASHVIEYWPDSGTWKDIAVLKNRVTAVQTVLSKPGTFTIKDGQQSRHFERTVDGAWHEQSEEAKNDAKNEAKPGDLSEAWHLHVQQALNQPPDIVAQGPHGANVRLTDLNPQVSASWGTMRAYNWKDAKGNLWKGGLMVPADFDPKVRHALVIQTYGFDPKRFYRDGGNVYDGDTSGFAGRAFLRENILVLALPAHSEAGAPADEHGQIRELDDGARAAIDDLVTAGWVDREKVGIIGWSATGERVLNMVTFTDIPIRAATLLDGDSNTVFSLSITYNLLDITQAGHLKANGGGPFGKTLQSWVQNDPALHTDCVRAALRIESYGPEVRNNWDIYALLRSQYKPVEMIDFPDGRHALARPSERMISLQGNVDWYRFWLNDEKRSEVFVPEETAASLKNQYLRWDEMKGLKVASDAKPACPLVASGQ